MWLHRRRASGRLRSAFVQHLLLQITVWALVLQAACGGLPPSSIVPAHPRRLERKNCSIENCFNAENVCGSYESPCMVVGRMQNGPSIWLKVSFELGDGPDYFYSRTERVSFYEKACNSGDAWAEFKFEGNWREEGPSETTLGLNRAHADIKSSWVTLVKDKVCLEQTPWNLAPPRCLSTVSAMTDICPCNGWDWSSSERPKTRNIGMFCAPAVQCPVLHEVYVAQTHFFSYNATVDSACFSKASLTRVRGWDDPRDDACIRKTSPSTCMYGRLSADSRRAAAVPLSQWVPTAWLAGILATLSASNGAGHLAFPGR